MPGQLAEVSDSSDCLQSAVILSANLASAARQGTPPDGAPFGAKWREFDGILPHR